jgi:hypothetical protein
MALLSAETSCQLNDLLGPSAELNKHILKKNLSTILILALIQWQNSNRLRSNAGLRY